jgi:SAM-dependent methyltransferase
MESVSEVIDNSFNKETYKCIISNPKNKSAGFRKIEFNLLDGFYQIEKHTATQVFHEKKSYEESKSYIADLLGDVYRNLNSWDSEYEFSCQLTKKGKVLFKRKKITSQTAPAVKTSHDRQKNYILKEGTIIEPLIDMGIFTKEGKVVKSMYDKYKQINRFIEIVDDELNKFDQEQINILDFGCGKSYLTFILYYYLSEIKNVKVNMVGLDLKDEVIQKCNITAEKYGYENLDFQIGDIKNYNQKDPIDMVISLHACDTATDYALFNAIKWNARMIFSVPCCQHEVNAQIQSKNFSILTRYGIVKEQFSSYLTDAIRCNLLEYCGYKTQMIEFVSFDHTPKNLMIRAVKKENYKPESALSEVIATFQEFNFHQKLYELLKDSSYLP